MVKTVIPDRKLFGDRVSLHRASAKLSVAQLAEKAGTVPQVVYDIENGTSNFTIDKLTAVIRACGISVEEFLRGASDEPAEFHDLFYMLKIVTASGNKDLLHGVRVSLEAMSEKAIRLKREREASRHSAEMHESPPSKRRRA